MLSSLKASLFIPLVPDGTDGAVKVFIIRRHRFCSNPGYQIPVVKGVFKKLGEVVEHLCKDTVANIVLPPFELAHWYRCHNAIAETLYLSKLCAPRKTCDLAPNFARQRRRLHDSLNPNCLEQLEMSAATKGKANDDMMNVVLFAVFVVQARG